ncbi:MAG: hypothetical protein KBT46_05605 [Ruminococcus sp.]|nr:hypothetical protein [Candidatus Copronaster equi]
MAKKRPYQEAEKMISGYNRYYNHIKNLALSRFKYAEYPESINFDFVEKNLYYGGAVAFFLDTVIGLIALPFTVLKWNIYGEPLTIRVTSPYNHAFRKVLNKGEFVIMYNNKVHSGDAEMCRYFANRLYSKDEIIDQNTEQQKTPYIIKATENQRLTILNLLNQYQSGKPFIVGDSSLDLSQLSVLNLNAPFVADKVSKIKSEIWNEMLNYLGIPNTEITKKERMIKDEVERMQGGAIATTASPYDVRCDAINKINSMYGLNIKIFKNSEVSESVHNTDEENN